MKPFNSAAVFAHILQLNVGLADDAALNQSAEGRLGVWSSYLTRISRDYSFI